MIPDQEDEVIEPLQPHQVGVSAVINGLETRTKNNFNQLFCSFDLLNRVVILVGQSYASCTPPRLSLHFICVSPGVPRQHLLCKTAI